MKILDEIKKKLFTENAQLLSWLVDGCWRQRHFYFRQFMRVDELVSVPSVILESVILRDAVNISVFKPLHSKAKLNNALVFTIKLYRCN